MSLIIFKDSVDEIICETIFFSVANKTCIMAIFTIPNQFIYPTSTCSNPVRRAWKVGRPTWAIRFPGVKTR